MSSNRFVDNLIIVKQNAYGLTRDAALLADAIGRAGAGTCETVGVRDRSVADVLYGRRRTRRAFHIERAFPNWFSASEENWLIPNQERFPKRQLYRLKGIDLVLAKTRHAEEIFAARGAATRYLGFTSEDRFDPAIAKNWNGFYHLAGASTLKGTDDLVALWKRHPEWPTLCLVQKQELAPRAVPPNIRLIARYLSDQELRELQNSHGIHLCPSRAEGWGHHILEGMSCRSVVLVTDAAPMNEHVDETCGILVAANHRQSRHLGFSYRVDPDALEATVQKILSLPEEEKIAIGSRARQRFEEIDAAFTRRLADLLQTHDSMGKGEWADVHA
ncbi:MAG TPA: glycosyltransferase [Pararhizobium sp.]|nr:glycosyltransferase [Pararhizobium sp.]